MNIRLRPHHLLCTQGYSGKGYDDAFVANMTAVTARLRSEEAVRVELVFSTDDLCAACPNRLGEDLCEENEKVKRYDRKVVSYFGLEEKRYVYQDVIREINGNMTAEMMEDICDGCCWYPVSACKRRICGDAAEKR